MGGLRGRVEDRQSVSFPQRFGEFDDEDGVLRGQSHEQKDPQLGIDAQRQLHDPHASQSAAESRYQRQEHRQGQRPTLVLSHQEKIAEEQRQQQHAAQFAGFAGALFLKAHAGPLVAIAFGQFFCQFFKESHPPPGADAGFESYGNGGCGIEVVAIHFARPQAFFRRRQSAQGHLPSGPAADMAPRHPVDVLPKRRVRSQKDLVGLVPKVDVVHVVSAEIALERRKNRRDRYV